MMARRKKAPVEETAPETEDQEPVLTDEEDVTPEAERQEEEPAVERQVVESQGEESASYETVVIEVQVRELREAMGLIGPIVPKKPVLEALSCVQLRNGQAMATDLEISATVDLPGFEGHCLVPYRPVLDLIRYIPGHEVLAIEQRGRDLNLSWSEGKASYETYEPVDYPPLREPEAKVEAIVDGDTLVSSLLAMVGYCATEESRPVLTGVTVFLGDSVEIAAGDGYRMAYRTLPVAIPTEEDGMSNVIIPTRAIEFLNHLWTKAPRTAPAVDSLVELVSSRGKLHLSLGSNGLRARFGPVSMVSQLIAGTPPNFKQLIPTEPPTGVYIYAPDLERAVRRVRGVAEDAKGIVRLAWENGTMTVSARGEEKASVEATIPVQTQGDPGKVALNVKYLLEYLKGKTGMVTMGITSPTAPVLFRYASSPLVLIMPMFAQ